MANPLTTALEKFRRDRAKGTSTRRLVERAARYSYELAAAKLYLRDVSVVGSGVRCNGRPRIVNHGTMIIGANTLLRSVMVAVELTCDEKAVLTIGQDCSINYGASIGCTKQIEIGPRCRLGPYTMIIDSQFHELYDRRARPAGVFTVLESDVWLGAKVSVMPGVRIGKASVVATGAVVTKDVPPFTVVAGVPAKVIDRIDPEKFVARAPSGAEAED